MQPLKLNEFKYTNQIAFEDTRFYTVLIIHTNKIDNKTRGEFRT